MTVSIKVSDDLYAKLKWLKTRYQAVKEKDMTWDEFLQSVIEDNLILLAYLITRKVPNVSLEMAQGFLLGSFYSIDEIMNEDRKIILDKLNQIGGS